RQAIYLVIGLILAAVAYKIDYRKLRAWAPYILLLCIAGLLTVFVPHVGFTVSGARRWIGAGSVSLQPSEFAKLGLVIFLSAALANRGERITSLTRGLAPLCVPVFLTAMLVLI